MYVELHAASAFSFLEGASLPERLVDRAAELGYPALALLDRDGVYGAPRFHKAATAAGIRPIIGAELTMVQGRHNQGVVDRRPYAADRGSTGDGRPQGPPLPLPIADHPSSPADSRPTLDSRLPWRLPVLVESQEGYRNLCRLITRMKLRSEKGEGVLTLEDLDGATAGLVALAGREALVAGRHGVGGLVDRLVGLFGRPNVYLELERHFLRDEEAANEVLAELASAFHVPTVITNGVRFSGATERPLFDVLTCIRHKTTLAAAGRRLAVNAERYLKPPSEMEALFEDYPAALAATRELGERLRYTMADLGYRFPAYPVPAGETMISFLRKMTEIGARERYRPYHERARRQMARELDLIEKLDLAGYFLIVWDIVNFCRQNRILVQGRGSAANSAVCYSLGITAVDPVGMDLLFERFLSEERGEWPDIDLDLPSGDRRERVIQHVYEKYGRHGAAMTANVITYRGRSAAREVGKVLGIEAVEIDRLAKVMGHFEFRPSTAGRGEPVEPKDPAETFGEHVRTVGLDVTEPRIQLFGLLWRQIQDLPRHLGQHSGGMVICQGQLDTVVPLENASMPDRVVVQWDKDDCADMGIVKIDLLGLGMMAVLQDTLGLINRGRGLSPAVTADLKVRPTFDGANEPLGLWNLPQDDPEVYRMLQAADTMGVFQVESRAQMATLPRLKPARFYDIVVEVAIIRPGPIVGQMVHPYLNRRAGREPVVYPHPSLEPILARTLGVPLFQEQLLRIAMVAAGFTGGQAEELRRAFGFKRSERRMQQIEVQLRAGMTKKGITGKPADDIIRSITSFALYGFPESHSASFALLVYASAYLKAHFPAAFYAGLLNNQPMGFYHPGTLVKDAQRRGVRFAPVDVERSDWLCTVEADGAIRLGLCYVNGLRRDVAERIAAATPGAQPVSGQFSAGTNSSRSSADKSLRSSHCSAAQGASSAAQGASSAAQGPSSAAQGPSSAAQGPSSAAQGPSSAAQGPSSAAQGPSSAAQGPSSAAQGPSSAAQGPSSAAQGSSSAAQGFSPVCPKCHCDDRSMLEIVTDGPRRAWFCNNCAHDWKETAAWSPRFRSVEDLIAKTGISREELATLAEIGALNAFGYDRREALWQIERAIRPAGALYEGLEGQEGQVGSRPSTIDPRPSTTKCPLPPMSDLDRLVADYEGTSMTIGPHPMALHRRELSLRGVLRAADLPRERHGRRVRVAGMVITRQRPGTAKGFVFLTLEDETGISNIIVRPDLFDRARLAVLGESFLLIEGTLQNQEGVTSIRAERLEGIRSLPLETESHDFY